MVRSPERHETDTHYQRIAFSYCFNLLDLQLMRLARSLGLHPFADQRNIGAIGNTGIWYQSRIIFLEFRPAYSLAKVGSGKTAWTFASVEPSPTRAKAIFFCLRTLRTSPAILTLSLPRPGSKSSALSSSLAWLTVEGDSSEEVSLL